MIKEPEHISKVSPKIKGSYLVINKEQDHILKILDQEQNTNDIVRVDRF